MDVKEMARMGGIARASKLTPEKRRLIAQNAGKASWPRQIVKRPSKAKVRAETTGKRRLGEVRPRLLRPSERS